MRSQQRALDKLNQLAPGQFQEPIPVLGNYEVFDTPVGLRPSIMIRWVEPGNDVTGVFIVDAEGRKFEFPGVVDTKDLSPEHVRWFTATRFRVTWIPVVIDQATEEAWRKSRAPWKPLALQEAVLKDGIRMGLLTREGKRTEAVEVFVSKEVRRIEDDALSRPASTYPSTQPTDGR